MSWLRLQGVHCVFKEIFAFIFVLSCVVELF